MHKEEGHSEEKRYLEDLDVDRRIILEEGLGRTNLFFSFDAIRRSVETDEIQEGKWGDTQT
jgi:hypothetical protein